MTVVRFPDGKPLFQRDRLDDMTATLADMFDDPESLAALIAEGEALAAPPEPWNLEFLGPTVEVNAYRPFQGQPERAGEVWATVDRKGAVERLVGPAPIVDPALVDRTEE